MEIGHGLEWVFLRLIGVVGIDPCEIGIAVGIRVDDRVKDGGVEFHTAKEFVEKGALLRSAPEVLLLPSPKILRVLPPFCFSSPPLDTFSFLHHLLPTSSTHLCLRTLPLLCVTHRA